MGVSPGGSEDPWQPAIAVVDLAKRYEPAGVEALRGVSFTVDEGEIFGLLGRNGAGKSTAVRILTTLLRPTSGTAHVLGTDVVAEPGPVRRQLGVALQDAALDELMTGREHLLLAARLAGHPNVRARDRAGELLETFGLSGAGDRIAGRYSGGMRRRLDVAMALIRDPRILFLDEPTTGLDPQSRRALWELTRRLRDQGTTVFLTTQYMAEADALCQRVAIVHEGRIAAVGTPGELKDAHGTTTVRVRVHDRVPVDRLRAATGTAPVAQPGDDGWLELDVAGGEAAVPAVVARVTAELGSAVERLAVVPPTLEDVFVTLTGTDLEVGAESLADAPLSAIRRGIGSPARGS